ncbi:hypothetical protein GCM10007874_68930 [Labrys miyagiensis]|uniref:Uncharacterized protein n=1 Tax=Labrys miyagiensis TaxID=346912 RepID=A0ABQ6CW77_9HYPH|nr:hypothetical protein GCM10007874_68930 [Labrys miyagiensis]
MTGTVLSCETGRVVAGTPAINSFTLVLSVCGLRRGRDGAVSKSRGLGEAEVFPDEEEEVSEVREDRVLDRAKAGRGHKFGHGLQTAYG